MKAHVLQHVSFEGLGSIEEWLAKRGAEVTWTRFFEASSLPAVAGLDLVIALGGPMSVNDEAELPWLVDEKRFVAEVVRRGTALLGVCLGAQLIASALGARVYRNPRKEIGWYEIEPTPSRPDAFQFSGPLNVFHWHGETFDLPAGAVRLAASAACENQAFQIGGRTIGLQFHLETTPESAGRLISHCRSELVEDRFVQGEAELRNVPPSSYAAINACMAEVLEYLTRRGP